MNFARQQKLKEYGQNNIFGGSGNNKTMDNRKSFGRDDYETKSMMSFRTSNVKDSETTSVYSMATSTTTYSQMSQVKQGEDKYAGMTREQRHEAKKMKREVERQRKKLFGKQEKRHKQFETSYNVMGYQTKDQRIKQQETTKKLEADRQARQENPKQKFQKEFYGQDGKISASTVVSPSHQLISQTMKWDQYYQTPRQQPLKEKEQNLNSMQRKYQNLNSNIFNEESAEKTVQVPKNVVKAQYATMADWKNTITNNKADNHIATKKIDTFRERQKQLGSSFFQTRDYTKFQPITKKFIDMDNLYDQKRMNDPMYSDLFDQCMNTGGRRPSPIRKKVDDIAYASKDWTSLDLQQKVKRDYSNYKAKDQKIKEFRTSYQPCKVVEIDLNKV